jgi:TolB-like protein/Flp pilus assembly protein TadD
VSFFNELQRRNVFRVAVAYLAGAWLLTEVSETLFSIYGLSEAAARIVVTLLAIGFPITLVLSWIYELTPEGLKLDKDIDRATPIPRTATRRLDRAIIVLLALALGYFAFDKFVLEPARDADLVEETAQQARSDALVESYGDYSIAVLPFVNMSEDEGNEYFSDGISEELLNLLARIPELRVISRSSAFAYKGEKINIPEVAEQLNVAHILEGSVRKAEGQVRITAQLIEARSDTHLWSKTYDRELGDIFVVQEEIAAAIADALRLELVGAGGNTRLPKVTETSDSNAYDAYLQGRELIRQRGISNLEQAIDRLEHALRLDGNFAPAHAQLAIAHTLLAFQSRFNAEETRQTVNPHLDRALELEPELADAHAGRALLAGLSGDPESEIRHARRALALKPNDADSMNWLLIALENLGRYAEADTVIQQMLIADPLTIVGRYNYAEWLSERGQTEEAHELAEQLFAQSPKWSFNAHAITALIWEGKIAEGLHWALKDAPDVDSSVLAMLWIGAYEEVRRLRPHVAPWIDLVDGRLDEAVQAVQTALQHAPRNEMATWTAAEILYDAGRRDEALGLYERLLELVPTGRPIRSSMPNYRSSNETMMRLALARRFSGDEEGAQGAARIVRQDHAARRAVGINDQFQQRTQAMLAAFEQDREGTIEALELAVQLGLRDRQVLDDAIFFELRSDSRFVALKGELDRILDEEHKKALQLICFHNPKPDNWRPLPETCEGV